MKRAIEPDQACAVFLSIARQELFALRKSILDSQKTIQSSMRTIEESQRLLKAVSDRLNPLLAVRRTRRD